MTDDRLRRWLEAANDPRRPDPAFAAALLTDLREELGFASPGARRVQRGGVSWRSTSDRRNGRRAALLLVAALIIAALAGLGLAAGAIRDRLAPPLSSEDGLLAAIQHGGTIRIAIRPDHPQFSISGQEAAGFDADVAREIARRLGVSADIVLLPATSIASPTATDAWDLGLPSVASWTLDPTAFRTTSVYYRWPHRLVVPIGARATSLHDVAAGPICAVSGDAGQAWLSGRGGDPSATPVTTSITTRSTDAQCLAALASGDAVAAVTADLSDAELATRSDVRVIDGPAPEPRVAIIRARAGGADPSALVHAVDDALAAMRADGTLSRLSQNRFGGADLTGP